METDPLKKTSQHFFIVDYDVPREPQSKRQAFYRQLSKIKQKMGLFGKMSTMSVVVTADRTLATEIYLLAKKYGRANLYLGFRKCDDELYVTRGTCDIKGTNIPDTFLCEDV